STQRLGMRKVEAEAILRDQATLLRYMPAKAVAERCVQQVRRAVVGANAVAALGIDRKLYRIADLQCPRLELRLMRVQAAERFAGVANKRPCAFERRDRPGIAHLASAFTVK